MAAHVIRHAVERSGLEPDEIEDVILGCGVPEGTTGQNVARIAAVRAGLPITIGGETINRFCSSGLMAISTAAQRVIVDGVPALVAGGVESISLVKRNDSRLRNEWIDEHEPALYWPMIETAEVVAERYGVSRERQDEYALLSQQRTAAAQAAGRFDAEIVPLPSRKAVVDKASGAVSYEDVVLTRDEGNRPDTTRGRTWRSSQPVRGPGKTITAGNASQLSDGASACVVMDAELAARRGIAPLGFYRGMVVVGCEPDEMGIGPVFAVPKLLERHGLSVDDIDLWELNEAFAVQALYCRETLGIPLERFNVDGGAISIGHPYGMSGARHGRPRADRGQAPRRQARRGHHVRRRRPGRRRRCSRWRDHDQSPPPMVMPPSITIVWPVMNAPAPEARNTAAPATSSGSPMRRSG